MRVVEPLRDRIALHAGERDVRGPIEAADRRVDDVLVARDDRQAEGRRDESDQENASHSTGEEETGGGGTGMPMRATIRSQVGELGSRSITPIVDSLKLVTNA